MKLFKSAVYGDSKVTVREWIFIREDGSICVIQEHAEIDYSTAINHREKYAAAPKVYRSNDLCDTIEVWPEFDSPELRSFAAWVSEGKHDAKHPDAAFFMYRGDGVYQWVNGNQDSKDQFVHARRKKAASV
jgi:hypothetical protein